MMSSRGVVTMHEETLSTGFPFQMPKVSADQLPTLAEWNSRYIDYVLNFTKGKKTAAARILGINRRTLYRRNKAKNGDDQADLLDDGHLGDGHQEDDHDEFNQVANHIAGDAHAGQFSNRSLNGPLVNNPVGSAIVGQTILTTQSMVSQQEH